MAKFEVSGFADVEKQLLQRTERAAIAVPLMLEAGAKVLVEAHKSEIEMTFSSDRSTGALAESIKSSGVEGGELGKYIEVSPTGKDKKGVSNATKGFVLQYGRSNMPARPWMTAANAKAEGDVNAAMRREWEAANA